MRIAKFFLAIGIAIILTIFVAYGLHAVYEKPKYDNYSGSFSCNEKFDCSEYSKKCSSGPEYQECYSRVVESGEYKNCLELRDQCREDYVKKTDTYKHSRNSFYILISIAVISIIIGSLLIKLEGIGSGLIGGGVLIVIWSLIYTATYWFSLNRYVKLTAIGVILVILIYLGYKRIEKTKK